MGKRARANEMHNHAKIYCTTRYELKFRVQSAWAVCDVHGKIDNDYDIGHSNWFYKLQDNIKRLTGRCLVVISSFLNSIEVPFPVDKYFFYRLLLHTAVK